MDIYSNLQDLCRAPRNAVLTLGVFDGCHRGHRALLQHTLDTAKKNKRPAGVLTFSSHPNLILHPDKPARLLMSPEHRLFIFEEMGFDFTAIVPFTSSIRATSAERFIQYHLIEELCISHLCLGYDSHFGANRRGDATLARTLLQPHQIGVDNIEALDMQGPISSTRIRNLLNNKDLPGACQLLGAPFSVLGRIGHGDERGRVLGFPTANILLDFELPLPQGVWAAEALLPNGQSYPAAIDWGSRPTFAGATSSLDRLEAHLIGFEGDLYGERIEIRFRSFIRDEIRFSSPELLIEQLKKDCITITTVLNGL